MLFHVSSHLEYEVKFPSSLILNIHAQRNSGQTILEESFTVTPNIKAEEFPLDNGMNRFLRMETGDEKKIVIDYAAIVECTFDILPTSELDATTISELDPTAIPFLFPSRYCQSDLLDRLAWDLFGKIAKPYEKVNAIVDWIHKNVEYVRGTTTAITSAYDTVTQRTGVCRDFAHLGIALCRALDIPARYVSAYAYQLDPPDFHAVFECHLGGRWILFDATRLAPLNGLVRIGVSRDASDGAVACIFGEAQCTAMNVSCMLVEGQTFTPLAKTHLLRRDIPLESSHAAATD
ncbi:transglutaminase family protein [soil metagenome]